MHIRSLSLFAVSYLQANFTSNRKDDAALIHRVARLTITIHAGFLARIDCLLPRFLLLRAKNVSISSYIGICIAQELLRSSAHATCCNEATCMPSNRAERCIAWSSTVYKYALEAILPLPNPLALAFIAWIIWHLMRTSLSCSVSCGPVEQLCSVTIK